VDGWLGKIWWGILKGEKLFYDLEFSCLFYV